jgi:two-component system chemotaxis sensor kinase CheA
MGSRYLLVEAGERRAAVPLGDVLRIERIPFSRVEYIGYRPVLNFEGQLLPIEDSAGVFATVQGNPDAQLIVVVCREGNRQVGIAVSHVLDVAAGNELFEAGSQHRASGVTLLNDHVTGIVDLGAIQPLPMAHQGSIAQNSEWNQVSNQVSETLA